MLSKDEVLPPDGIYAGIVELADQSRYKAAVSRVSGFKRYSGTKIDQESASCWAF